MRVSKNKILTILNVISFGLVLQVQSWAIASNGTTNQKLI